MGSRGSLLVSYYGHYHYYYGHYKSLSIQDMDNVRRVKRLTRKEVPIAVRFILSPVLTVGHRGHLLGRGASHLLLLLLKSSPPHS